MAVTNCSVFSLFAPSHNSITRRISHPLIILSSIPSSKLTHRKNHLRPKILKTLNPKSYPPPPTLPHLPLQPQEEKSLFVVEIPATAEESVEFENLQVSEYEATKEYNGEFEDLQVSEATAECNGEIKEDLQVSVSEPTTQYNGVSSGGVQEASFPKSALEVIQLGELSTQNSQGTVEENLDPSPIFEKDDVHSINGSSRHGLAEKTSAANRDKVKQANTKTDIWWLNLRYVLVILMQRDINGGQKALYKLKFTSTEQDQSVDSYIVAFEDHGDANNFCVLLESYFEDVDDFSAYPVPMTIQELNEEIASHAKKVVVVKKRQLQLYAGQPFTDVEMALRSLIEQDQKVS